MTSVDELYREIVERQPDGLGSQVMMLNLYEGLAASIDETRTRVAQAGEADEGRVTMLEKWTAMYRRGTSVDPLPVAEGKELTARLTAEFHRRCDAWRRTDAYRQQKEAVRDFLD